MFGIYEDGEVIARFVTPTTVNSNVPVFISDTLSLQRKAASRGAQRWEISSKLEPLTYSAADLFVNITTMGYTEVVQVRIPQNWGAYRRLTFSGTALGTASAGETDVNIVDNYGIIPKGTFITFANHAKVYLLKNDVTTSSPLHLHRYQT